MTVMQIKTESVKLNMNTTNRPVLSFIVSILFIAFVNGVWAATPERQMTANLTDGLSGSTGDGATASKSPPGPENGTSIDTAALTLPTTTRMEKNDARTCPSDSFAGGLADEVQNRCGDLSSMAEILATACCDYGRALGESLTLRVGGIADRSSDSRERTRFRLFDGALISRGGASESREPMDWRHLASDTSPSTTKWAGKDAATEPRGLRLFSWRW